MNFSQKLVSDFKKLGNLSTRDANVALQVYLELCEVKKYWDVDYKFHNELQLLYFTAKKAKSENTSIFAPRSSCDDLSFNQINNYFKLCDGSETNSLFLVLVTSDSTCVYYQISDGLHEPKDTSAKHLKLNMQEKRDADIRKYKDVIAEAALCGTTVTIGNSNQDSNTQ